MTFRRIAAIISASLVFAGMCGAWYFSAPSSASMSMKLGESVTFRLWRLHAEPAEMSLYFKRDFGKFRDELGRYPDSGGIRNGQLHSPYPGTPIKVQISANGESTVLEALPAQGADMEHWERQLVPFVDDTNPQQVPWPPRVSGFPELRWGLNTITASVLEVGDAIKGEDVNIYLRAPMSRHRYSDTQQAYDFFRWFRWWPINMIILAICAVLAFPRALETSEK